MNFKYSHARELFSDAIEILSTGQNDIRHRLYDVGEAIHHLQYSELPDELIEEWKDIRKKLENIKIHKISPTLNISEKKINIRNKTGEKIAERIWYIYNELHFCEKYL